MWVNWPFHCYQSFSPTPVNIDQKKCAQSSSLHRNLSRLWRLFLSCYMSDLNHSPQLVTYFRGKVFAFGKADEEHTVVPQSLQYLVASCRFSLFYRHGIKHVDSLEECVILLSHANLPACTVYCITKADTLLHTCRSMLFVHILIHLN